MTSTVLEGRTAIVTGAARGLGRAYALELAAMGANLVVSDLDLKSYRQFDREIEKGGGRSTVEEIEARGGRAIGIEADVTDRDAMTRLARAAADAFAAVDIVVCNAGGGSGDRARSAASELDDTELRVVLDRNLIGTVNTVVAAAPYMKRQKRGKIITVSSTAGLRPMPAGTYAHYGMAKAAIVMYTRYLAQDLGPHGITANCIAPGQIGTGRMMDTFEKVGIDKIAGDIPLGRLGSVEDCASVIGFLASPAADYMTGIVLTVDGGQGRT